MEISSVNAFTGALGIHGTTFDGVNVSALSQASKYWVERSSAQEEGQGDH